MRCSRRLFISREFPKAPIVAVAAVILDEDRVLLVRRAQEPRNGEWSLPGGAVELGESLEDAVRREAKEEAGLQVEPLQLLQVLSSIVREDDAVRFHYVIVEFLCTVAGGVIGAATDVDDVRWVPRVEVAGYGLSAAAIAVIDSAFRTRF